MVSGRFKQSPTVLRAQPRLEQLKKSTFNTPEDVASFSQKFDDGLKKVFFDDTGTKYVKFGGLRDHDPQHGIKGGKLALTG